MKSLRAVLLPVLAIGISAAARAATPLDYVVTEGNDVVERFTLDLNPVPIESYRSGFLVSDTLSFFAVNNIFDGGFNIADDANGPFRSYSGLQLYTGTTSQPTMLLGQFNLSDYTPTGNVPAHLSVSLAAVSAVPEPESYALMLAGLTTLAAVARRRARATRSSV